MIHPDDRDTGWKDTLSRLWWSLVAAALMGAVWFAAILLVGYLRHYA